MKRQLFKTSILAISTFFITACSKEHIEPNKNEPTQGIVFTMSEAPYNDDVDIATRANAMQPVKDTIYWEGVEAEVTLERDTEQPKQATRTITSGNHYTIVVFNTGTSVEVTKIKGHFDAVTGFFKYDADSESREIPTGFYDFVCYTHQYATRSGNTVTIPQANAGKAFVCRQTNVEVKNVKQQTIAFTMKHVGARVRTKLMAIGNITGVNATLGYQANKVAASIDYDMVTGNMTTSTAKNSTATSATQSYTVKGTQHDAALDEDLTTITGNDYLSVLAGTKPEELVYNITGGMVYNTTLNTKGDRKLKATGVLEANGAYTLTIRLLPRYVYLFEDGKTGHLKEGDRSNHIPIAIVFDGKGKRAIALWDANGGVKTKWDTDNDVSYQRNSTMFRYSDEGGKNTTSGKVWTWESYDSFHNGTSIIKANTPQFAAYHYAGKFYKSNDLTNRLNGKVLDSKLNKDGVWYLPSWYEWKEVLVKLGFGDNSQVIGTGTFVGWKGNLVKHAFVAANGTSIINEEFYWSSSEFTENFVYTVRPGVSVIFFNANTKEANHPQVRPFVAY